MTPEGRIQTSIVKAYMKRGAWAVKIHGGPMQPRVVDILACYRGIFVAIEVKVPGKDATPRQRATLDDIERRSGFTVVAHSADEALALLDTLDEKFKLWRRARKRVERQLNAS